MRRDASMAGDRGRAVRNGRRDIHHLPLAGMNVPAVLQLPDADERAPAVLLLHGYRSHKEQMADTVGRALLDVGVASLAVDLPLHGERERDLDAGAQRNPLALVAVWRAAQSECRDALRWMADHPAIDAERLGVAGYSMGAFLGVIVASKNPAVRALVLAAGGDLPEGTPFERVIRTVADPARAVRSLRGIPLLMVHGRRDRTVLPDQAQRFFEAAHEPKELRWYDAGHWLPDAAVSDAATWLAARLGRRDVP
ncbi:MAG TPA: alpha/beta fold hydrolase [Gemmatimonadaceae bacterium]|nr:alpha/beta fold hydrolase [Gemmatimonadaceae bacterium]